MDYKKVNAAKTTETRDIETIEAQTGNIYETVAILAKRADQINLEIKQELSEKLEEFASSTDNLEEIFENKEQIEISKFYERLPKPTAIAIKEMLDKKVYFRNPNKQNDNEGENNKELSS